MLYTEKDLERSLDRIEVVNFHQEVEVGGVKFWAYTAGHVLGAAMFMIEIAGVKVSEGEGLVILLPLVPNSLSDLLHELSNTL